MKTIRNKGGEKLGATTFTRKIWNGYDRRTKARRAEDLKRCVLCNIHFSWKHSTPVCSACADKLSVMYQNKGKIVNTIA